MIEIDVHINTQLELKECKQNGDASTWTWGKMPEESQT